jgi:hypothetical protein
VKNLAGMLELLFPPSDVRAAFRSLSSPNVSLRARALEYLHNTLGGSLRHDVFAMIDDAPAEEKLQQAEHEFDIPMENADRTIERILRTDTEADPSAVGLVLAAMHATHVGRTQGLYPLLREMAGRADPLLSETALWVLARAGTSR